MEKKKILAKGEIVFKTDEGIYFHAIDESYMPLLISEEEGNKLWKEGREMDQIGVSKETLFKSWVEELGYDKAVLLSCNYDVKRVVEMSNEEAESEVEAINY